jgi:peroxidase
MGTKRRSGPRQTGTAAADLMSREVSLQYYSRQSAKILRAAIVGAGVGLGVAIQADRPGAVEPDESAVSPVLNISPAPVRPLSDGLPLQLLSVRSIDGSWNNLDDPDMGSAFTPLIRWVDPDYADRVSEFAGPNRPNPRVISNLVNDQAGAIPSRQRLSDVFWQWGQFLDHDIDLTDGTDPPEEANIQVPIYDPDFDSTGTGTVEIPFNRSIYDMDTGTDVHNPREQLNQVTSWIDGSNVYGSDAVRAAALRTNDGTGRLRVSAGDLLPFNTDGLPNAGGSDPSLFLAGDVRANEQVGLTAFHTLFVREHNRLAALVADQHPAMSGEEIYQEARRLVGALIQSITYNEFLPLLLGNSTLKPYKGYDPGVEASIANIFSTAAYRFGHSLLGSQLWRLDAEGNEILNGHLSLRDAFFSPELIVEDGIEPLLRGLAYQICQTVDSFLVDDVRNFLFGPPGSGGFDLAALNIQRGRDHGLPSYNDAREAFGLTQVTSYSEISQDPEIQDRLAAAYDDIGEMDVWVGGLAEDPWHKAQVGPLFAAILKRQFETLRDGDRFWYERILTRIELRQIEKTRLSDVIRRNTEIGDEIADDGFRVF